MRICIPCRREMTCIQTGASFVFGPTNDWVYAGDVFQCKKCGIKIAVTNANGYKSKETIEDDDTLNFKMEEGIL